MKKEKNIISELQRMREMMGVKPMNRITERYIMESVNRRVRLITEASGGGGDLGERAIKALFGDDVFAKSAAESFETGAKELSQTLEKEGLTNIDNLISKIASTKKINTSDVTDEMIDDSLKLFFKNNPKIADNVLQSSSKFIADTLKGKNFLDILGAGNKQLADDISFIVTNISEDPSVMRLMADDISDLSKKFKTATAGDSTPGVKDIQNALDAAANVSKKSKEGFANIPTKPDAVEIKSEDLTTKSVDNLGKNVEADKIVSEIKGVLDNLSASQKQAISDYVEQLSEADAKKIVDDAVNNKGKYSSGYLTSGGITPEKIEGFATMAGKIVKLIAWDWYAPTLMAIGKGGWSGIKGLAFIVIGITVAYFGWNWLSGNYDNKIKIPKILDTAEEECVDDITGFETLNEDMQRYAAIYFGCAKTRDASGNNQIKGFSMNEDNNMVVSYPDCVEVYSVETGGGTGSRISSTCDGSSPNENEEPVVGGGGDNNSEGGNTPPSGEEGALEDIDQL